MNVKLYNAAVMQLRAKAMESMALVDLYLTSPTMVPDHSSLVEEIVKHTRAMAEYEGAMLTLQQYFSPAPTPQQAVPQAPPPSPEPITEEELQKRSPTFRKSQQQKAQRAPKKTTKTKAAAKTKVVTTDDSEKS